VGLLELVVIAVVVTLASGLLTQSCASSSRADSYKSYMADVQQIATQSNANGRRLGTVLTTPGLSAQQIQSKLNAIAQQEQQNVNQANDIRPPGRLRIEHSHMVDALTLRVAGLEGLSQAFGSAAKNQTDKDSVILAGQANRLLASDIVWSDLFQAPARAQLEKDGVEGVIVPTSQVV